MDKSEININDVDEYTLVKVAKIEELETVNKILQSQLHEAKDMIDKLKGKLIKISELIK